MQIQNKELGAVVAVEVLERRLDARVAAEFKAHMFGLIEAGRHLIALDLSAVDFVDSSGIGAIISSLKALGKKGDITIAIGTDAVRQMFNLTRMDKVFRVLGSQQEAVAALAAGT